jgi:hypothetical protein
LLRNAHHVPAIKDDTGFNTRVDHDVPLHIRERHEVQPGLQLKIRQHRCKMLRFFLRLFVRVRKTVEVDEHGAAASLDHLPGRHRGIDTPGQANNHLTARSAWKSARAWLPFRVHKRISFGDLDPANALRFLEIHTCLRPFFDERADALIDFYGGVRV